MAKAKTSKSADRFPPPTTSLNAFVNNGSDQAFRQLIYDLTRLFNLMLRNRKHFGAAIGVTDAQALMMTIIAETGGTTAAYIAGELEVSSQFVTTEMAQLVAKGIVEKRPHATDRRSVLLGLTSKGRDLLRAQAPLRQRTNDTMFRSLTKERAILLQQIVSDLIRDGKIALHDLESPRRT